MRKAKKIRFTVWVAVVSVLVVAFAGLSFTAAAVGQLPQPDANTDVWDGSVDAEWNPKEAGLPEPWHIETGAQLAKLAQLVNAGGFGAHQIILDNDIDLSGHPWTPVGTEANIFEGGFDGNGHRIFNLNVDFVNEDQMGGRNDAGLFGVVKFSHSSVKNLGIVGGEVRGWEHAGAVAGWLSDNASVSNCHAVNVTVAGRSCKGGLVGFIKWGGGTIKNCYADVRMEAYDNTGGGWAGGILGVVDNGTERVESCFAFVDCAWEDQQLTGTWGTRLQSREELFAAGTVEELNLNQEFPVWTLPAGGGYPQLDLYENDRPWIKVSTAESVTSQSAEVTLSLDTKGADCTEAGIFFRELPGGTEQTVQVQGESMVCVLDALRPEATYRFKAYAVIGGTRIESAPREFTTMSLEGAGTPENPFLIQGLEDFLVLRDSVQSGTDYAGKQIRLTADLDLQSVDSWRPVGTEQNQFKGVFDGDGHTVSNLLAQTREQYMGLFGFVNGEAGAEIKNLVLDNIAVEGSWNTGILIGKMINGVSVRNCRVSGMVYTDASEVGGIVGTVQDGGTVEGCAFTGSVRADNPDNEAVGALAGRINKGQLTVSECNVFDAFVVRNGLDLSSPAVGAQQEGGSVQISKTKAMVNVRTAAGTGGMYTTTGVLYATEDIQAANLFLAVYGEAVLKNVKTLVMTPNGTSQPFEFSDWTADPADTIKLFCWDREQLLPWFETKSLSLPAGE